ESVMPVDVLAEIAAHQRSDQRPEVDPHVIDRKTRVAPRIVFGIERSHERADVGLQQSSADYDQRQPEIESVQRGNRHGEMAQRNDDAAPQYAPAQAEVPVGEPTAGQAEEINHRGVEAVNRPGFGSRKAEPA